MDEWNNTEVEEEHIQNRYYGIYNMHGIYPNNTSTVSIKLGMEL